VRLSAGVMAPCEQLRRTRTWTELGEGARADFEQIATPDLVRDLREHRLKSPDGQDLIDVLIRRLDIS